MRILQFAVGGNPVPAINGGAVQQIVEELSYQFIKRNKKVTVISTASEHDKYKLSSIDKNGVNYQYIYLKKSVINNYVQIVKSLPEIIRTIRDNGPYDVVHIHNPIWLILFKLINNKIGKPNLVWQVHNQSRFAFLSKNQNINIVGVSESVLSGIGEQINENHVSVIHNFVNDNNFHIIDDYIEIKKNKETYNIPKGMFVIGYAGRISSEKGLHVLLDAIKYFTDDEKNKIKLLIAGSSWFKGAQKSKYEKEILRKAKGIDIEWLGYVDNWELYRFYNACDIFVFPSTWEEPAGLVSIEAQMCGTKILASEIGGIPEYLSPYESTFEAGNSYDLYKKIKEIKNNGSEEADIKKSRREWITNELSIDKIINQWLQLYEKKSTYNS